MPLEHRGLVKLSEECGELVQAAMKRITCPDDVHWDGSNLNERLADEIADVLAAIAVVRRYWKLDYDYPQSIGRISQKLIRGDGRIEALVTTLMAIGSFRMIRRLKCEG